LYHLYSLWHITGGTIFSWQTNLPTLLKKSSIELYGFFSQMNEYVGENPIVVIYLFYNNIPCKYDNGTSRTQ